MKFFEVTGRKKSVVSLEIGVAKSTFDNDSEVGGATIKLFHIHFPEVDLHWLLTGEGEMISKSENFGINKDSLIESQQRTISAYEKAIEMLYSKFQEEKSNH